MSNVRKGLGQLHLFSEEDQRSRRIKNLASQFSHNARRGGGVRERRLGILTGFMMLRLEFKV